MEAHPKPPCAKSKGGLADLESVGVADNSSSGPEAVLM